MIGVIASGKTRPVTGYDPEFIGGLSTEVVAQDLDRIRIALGEQKISYYGISWGTSLGAVYRSRLTVMSTGCCWIR